LVIQKPHFKMKKFIAVALFIIANPLLAQVQFETRVSKNTLALNERLRVDFIMNVVGDFRDKLTEEKTKKYSQ
jgi:hypothetical protein